MGPRHFKGHNIGGWGESCLNKLEALGAIPSLGWGRYIQIFMGYIYIYIKLEIDYIPIYYLFLNCLLAASVGLDFHIQILPEENPRLHVRLETVLGDKNTLFVFKTFFLPLG